MPSGDHTLTIHSLASEAQRKCDAPGSKREGCIIEGGYRSALLVSFLLIEVGSNPTANHSPLAVAPPTFTSRVSCAAITTPPCHVVHATLDPGLTSSLGLPPPPSPSSSSSSPSPSSPCVTIFAAAVVHIAQQSGGRPGPRGVLVGAANNKGWRKGICVL